MANRFWVGGTGTWTPLIRRTGLLRLAGPASGQSVPIRCDIVTFDVHSLPTVTVNHASLSIASLTAGFFTSGTLDFSANNNNVTVGAVVFDGTVTRTINMGSGTWTITGTSGTIF